MEHQGDTGLKHSIGGEATGAVGVRDRVKRRSWCILMKDTLCVSIVLIADGDDLELTYTYVNKHANINSYTLGYPPIHSATHLFTRALTRPSACSFMLTAHPSTHSLDHSLSRTQPVGTPVCACVIRDLLISENVVM